MPLEHWIAFTAASAVLLAIPGPTMLLVISHALGHGRRSGVATVAGVALGDFTAMTGSMLGLGALLAASATLFLVLKWIGAAYLIYLGIRLWRAPVAEDPAAEAGAARPSRVFLHGFAVTALNPKTLTFFIAFLPQFMVPSAPMLPQMALLEATFLVLAIATNTSVYLAASSVAHRAVGWPAFRRLLNRTGGGIFIGAGVLTLGWKRAG